MFQIIAIVIFYFRSSPRVKRKRQKTIDQCRPRAWPWASETYVFLRSMSFCRIDRAERQFAGGRKPAGQIAYAVLGEAVLQGAGGFAATAMEDVWMRLAEYSVRLWISPSLGEPAGEFDVLLHIAVHITLFFIFDRDQAGEILAMQFCHHLRNPGDASAQQHVDFATRGFDVL